MSLWVLVLVWVGWPFCLWALIFAGQLRKVRS
jgi:hypothetical protein